VTFALLTVHQVAAKDAKRHTKNHNPGVPEEVW